MLITLPTCAGALHIPYEAWMGAYVGERKMGYMSFKIDKAGTGYRIASVLDNHLTVLGSDLTQLVTSVVHKALIFMRGAMGAPGSVPSK